MIDDISKFPLFNELSPSEVVELEPYFFARNYVAGSTILRQGERAICLYLLTFGKVELIYKPYDGEPLRLTSLRAGDVFGWSAVMGHPFYSSSVNALEVCEVLAICGDDLHDFQKKHPVLGKKVLDRLAASIADRNLANEKQVSHMLRHNRPGRMPSEWKGDERMKTVQSPKVDQLKVLLGNLSAYIEQFHGGSVEFIALDGDTLEVKLGGACMGCPLSPATLHGWVEGTVKQFFPEIKHVIAKGVA